MSALDWIAINIGIWVYELAWAFPIMEALHFFGLCLMLGALLIVDLRLMGYNRAVPMVSTHDLLPIIVIGFGVNLLTGIGMFASDPHRYAFNTAFLLKMLLVVLAGVNALYHQTKLVQVMDGWGENEVIPTNAKVVGALSLLFWFAVLCYGRLIPYVGTGG